MLAAPAPSLAQAALPNSRGLRGDNLASAGCVFRKAGHPASAKPAPIKLVRDKWVFLLLGRQCLGVGGNESPVGAQGRRRCLSGAAGFPAHSHGDRFGEAEATAELRGG